MFCCFFFQIQLLEGFLELWSEYENNVQGLKTWLETQEKRLKQQQRVGDHASVQNAMKDCQVTGQAADTLQLPVSRPGPSQSALPKNWE